MPKKSKKTAKQTVATTDEPEPVVTQSTKQVIIKTSKSKLIAEFDTKFSTWKTYNKHGQQVTGDIVIPKEVKHLFRYKQYVRVVLGDTLEYHNAVVKYTQTFSIHVPIALTQQVLAYFRENQHVQVFSI